MATEIERKFLVALDWSPGELEPIPVRQGYLTDNGAGTEIRVRAHGQERLMTVKRSRSSSGASVRDEIEFPLPEHVFDELWLLTEGQRVAKLRYAVPLGELEATVDVYADRNDGLRVVEVEFPDEQVAAGFTPPDWFGPEVTGDPRYSNRRLAQ
ncbi:MAG TPA: CYTH domain-containing protein [Pseudonocardiaceae bacterium]|jgi:CYTH domain-containing protein|nr:CYTH domain-containing protein [Pseudonocardiaceae bacterium]